MWPWNHESGIDSVEISTSKMCYTTLLCPVFEVFEVFIQYFSIYFYMQSITSNTSDTSCAVLSKIQCQGFPGQPSMHRVLYLARLIGPMYNPKHCSSTLDQHLHYPFKIQFSYCFVFYIYFLFIGLVTFLYYYSICIA